MIDGPVPALAAHASSPAGRAAARELELPPPLLAGDVDLEHVGALRALGEVPDRGDGRDGDDREDQRRDDRPADLERRVAVDLLRVVRRALAVAELDRDDRPWHRRPRMPMTIASDEDRDEEVVDLLRPRPVGLERVLPVVVRHRRQRAGATIPASRTGARDCAILGCLMPSSPRAPVRRPAPPNPSPATWRRLYPRPIRVGQLSNVVVRGRAGRNPPSRADLHRPSRSSEWARRCHSLSTLTEVSRYTRAPRSRSSSSRALVPASRITVPPLPITIPFWESRSTRTTTRYRRIGSAPRPRRRVRAPASGPSSSSSRPRAARR